MVDFADTGEPEAWPDVAEELAAGAEALRGTRWGNAMREAASELAALRKDAKRLDWLRDHLFEHKWNGVVGKGCAVQWQMAYDFRFQVHKLTDDSGIMAGDFRRAIDAAMASK